MKVVEHDAVKAHSEKGGDGDTPIKTGVVRYWITDHNYLEIRPAKNHPELIEVSVSGSRSGVLKILGHSANVVYIGSEPF